MSQLVSRIFKLELILGSISLAVPLIGYAINGSYMRYNGDDYCYANVLTKMGFWKAQWISYLQPQPYNGNRYSLTLFSDLSGLLGPRMNGILPALVIVIWLIGMIFVIRRIIQFTKISSSILETLIQAELLIFFTLYMAPSLTQILYWRSGMLPYLAPLVTNTFLIGIIIDQAHRNRVDLLGIVVIGLFALLSGGFSEAATALQLGFLTLLILILSLRHQIKWMRTVLKSVGVAWIFTLVSLLLLASSPANVTYMGKMSRPDVLTFLTISIKSALSFLYESITSLPLPTAILFIFSMGISWGIFSHQADPLKFSSLQWVKGTVFVILICLVLCICITAPSAYIQSAYPELRTLITARYIMNLAIFVIGGLTGLLFSNLSSSRNIFHCVRFGIITLLAIFCLYPIYASRNIYSTIPKYQRWASFWDDRDSEIRLARQNDILDVEVIKIDHIIPNVAELTEDSTFWYNQCAAGYYGVETIRADMPGWDLP